MKNKMKNNLIPGKKFNALLKSLAEDLTTLARAEFLISDEQIYEGVIMLLESFVKEIKPQKDEN